jgi:hypothetical protein
MYESEKYRNVSNFYLLTILLDSGCPIVTVGDACVLPKGCIAESNGNHCILLPFTTEYSGISDSPRNWHVLLQQ